MTGHDVAETNHGLLYSWKNSVHKSNIIFGNRNRLEMANYGYYSFSWTTFLQSIKASNCGILWKSIFCLLKQTALWVKACYILEIEYIVEHINMFSINIWEGNLTKGKEKLTVNQSNDIYRSFYSQEFLLLE